MSISNTINMSNTTTQPSVQPVEVNVIAVARPDGSRAQLNQSVAQDALSVAISSKNEPLALLFKTAIDSLNTALAPTLGDNAIHNAMSQDNRPVGTSGRIVSISTGFFAAYKTQNPGLSEADALTKFMAIIRGGFEKGFKEATDILTSLKVFNGDIAASIGKTHQLVIKGYADFEASFATPTTSADGTQPDSPAASIPLSKITTANDV